MFGLKVRFVRLFAWETLLPDTVRFTVIWQTLAIDLSLFFGVQGGGFIPEIDLF